MHCTLKILLKAMATRLADALERSGRLGPWQAGFRLHHGCGHWHVYACRR